MTPRVRVILAIAQRDLRSELSGRQGIGLPLIALALLLPASLVRVPGADSAGLGVQGAVPAAVLQIPDVRPGHRGTGFLEVEGVIQVYDYSIPEPIRAALDGEHPVVKVEAVRPPMRVPRRSLFFALISASTLTGAVSASIGGERSRNTLQALLSAAVSRAEIVLGKWVAWTGFGSLGGLLATVVAVVAGRQELGPWVLAVPAVPALTVALGLWLVRRTEDVIAGTSVSLRVLPAVLGVSGLLAWVLSEMHWLLGAAVPLGGALLAAGDLWDGAWLPTAVAILSAIATTAVLLAGTARDLDQHAPFRPSSDIRPVRAVTDGALALGAWWCVVPGPTLWGWAGNPAMTEVLHVERGLLAGSALFVTLAGMGIIRTTHPSERPDFMGFSPGTALLTGLAAGAGLALAPGLPIAHPWVAMAAGRLHTGLVPPAAVALPVILAQELWFRGWMQRRAGWLPAAFAFALVMAPFDPVAGVILGLSTGWAGRRGLATAVVARAVAWGVATAAALSL